MTTMVTSLSNLLVAGFILLTATTDVIRGDCVFESNTYKTDQVIKLKDDCHTAVVCHSDGHVRDVKRAVTKRCPLNTRCVNNECLCYHGLVVLSRDASGMVATCKHPSQCAHEGELRGNTFEWIGKDCRHRYRCDHGTVKTLGSHTCPANSVCDNDGACACTGFYMTGRMGVHMILRECKKTTYNKDKGVCSDGVKEYKPDVEWLQKDCTRKLRCTIYGIYDGQTYSCPENSVCDNGKCVCQGVASVAMRDSKGFVTECHEGCSDRINKYKLNEAWLQTDCKRKYTCTVNGIEPGRIHACPHRSSCDNSNFYGQCKCDEGFTSIGTDCEGFIVGCQRI